jgi:hypothetical protein
MFEIGSSTVAGTARLSSVIARGDDGMKRTWSVLIVAGIVLASACGGVILVEQAKAHYIPLFYLLGPLVAAMGIGFSVLHWSVSDEYLRQNFGGEENARRMREMWRGGWVGLLIGIAMVAAQYFLGPYIPMP